MKTELMYDATPGGVSAIPADAKIVAGYIDGLYQSYPLLVRRFGGRARVVSIGVNVGNLAEWSDVEPGNAIMSPAAVRADWEHKRAHGIEVPGFYADLTRMRDVVLPGLSGIPRSEFKLWLADWNGNENFIPLPGGAEAAKQFRDEGRYDVSVVNPEAFFGQAPPAPKRTHHNIGKKAPSRHLPHPGGKPKGKGSRTKRILHRAGHGVSHPKAAAGAGGGGLGVGIVAILVGAGVPITPAEAAGISTVIAYLLAILAPTPLPETPAE